MNYRSAIFGAAAAMGALVSAGAQAGILDFALPPGVYDLGYSYSQGGYTFTNSEGQDFSYGNWVAYGEPSLNADDTADIFQNYAGTSNTITNDSSTPFRFTSIGLAPVYNNGTGGTVDFTFNHVGGSSDSTSVTLASGVYGLQYFSFSESGLTSVVFTPTTTEGPWVQFDEVGLSTVPEASTWAMMMLGFAGLGFAGYRAKRTLLAL